MSETEENRVKRIHSILADAQRNRDERVERAKRAVKFFGVGYVYGTDVLMSVEEAEELMEYINDLAVGWYGGLVDV